LFARTFEPPTVDAPRSAAGVAASAGVPAGAAAAGPDDEWPGMGNGFGTAPVDAQAVVEAAAIASARRARAEEDRRGRMRP
jgi:hypothetical protein